MNEVAIPANARRDYEIYVALCDDAGTKPLDMVTWAQGEGYDVPDAAEEPRAISDLHPVVSWAHNFLFRMPDDEPPLPGTLADAIGSMPASKQIAWRRMTSSF
jgi:hypothetical protein